MALHGLIKRKEFWVPSLRGWIILVVGMTALFVTATSHIHPFLAQNNPIQAEILVVEGWLPDYALRGAVDEFRSNNYRLVITTGGLLEQGHFLSRHRSNAELAAETIKSLGLNEESVVAVPAGRVKHDRTYESALALKRWLVESRTSLKCLNLYSLGPHARRSQLLFQRALGDNIAVGIIASDIRDYDPEHWWEYSSGVTRVIGEVINYCYARFFFFPKSERAQGICIEVLRGANPHTAR
jgi:hypothetical protein